MLGDVDVGAGEAEPPRGVVRTAAPHLLTREAPRVTVALCARVATFGEVGAGARLGEQLAPDLFAGADLREPACALLGRRDREQRRRDDVEADEVGVEIRLVVAGELAARSR